MENVQYVTNEANCRSWPFSHQSDMVDQNILNFLPEREHGEVYKLLSSHMLMSDPIAADFLDSEYSPESICSRVALVCVCTCTWLKPFDAKTVCSYLF